MEGIAAAVVRLQQSVEFKCSKEGFINMPVGKVCDTVYRYMYIIHNVYRVTELLTNHLFGHDLVVPSTHIHDNSIGPIIIVQNAELGSIPQRLQLAP